MDSKALDACKALADAEAAGRDGPESGCVMKTKTMMVVKSALSESALYLGDNGRCFCGKLRCAGTTAHFTGRALSGQDVLAVTPKLARKHGLRCEMCKMTARRAVAKAAKP